MKGITTLLLAAFLPLLGISQSSLGKTDDLGRIAIAAVVPEAAGIPSNARNMLQNKLQQVATLNGLGATEHSAQFAMVPKVSIITKDITPTAPPQHAVTLEISFYIVDGVSKSIFSQTSVTYKGVGRSEDAAYTQAISNINPRHGQFKGFVEAGKQKIVEFYNSQCDVIISKARALAGQQKYEEALATLFNVPDISRECYNKCMDISVEIYKEYGNRKCNEFLSAAKAAWAGKELTKVEESLGKITPDMACYPEAQQLMATVTAAVEAEGGGAWGFKMKVYEDNVEKEKLMIEAGRDVARAWAYWGAAPHFKWGWLYPGYKDPEQPKAAAQPEKPAAKADSPAPATTTSQSTNQLGELKATVSKYNGNFKGNYHRIADGEFVGNGSVRTNDKCVYWDDPKDVYFILDLGQVRQINGFHISNHNTDVYMLECSEDGQTFSRMASIDKTWGRVDGYSDYRMETFSTVPSHKGYEPRIAFTPVKARYIKVYATECRYCSLSEVQLLGH